MYYRWAPTHEFAMAKKAVNLCNSNLIKWCKGLKDQFVSRLCFLSNGSIFWSETLRYFPNQTYYTFIFTHHAFIAFSPSLSFIFYPLVLIFPLIFSLSSFFLLIFPFFSLSADIPCQYHNIPLCADSIYVHNVL
jgi:hypothetical protein